LGGFVLELAVLSEFVVGDVGGGTGLEGVDLLIGRDGERQEVVVLVEAQQEMRESDYEQGGATHGDAGQTGGEDVPVIEGAGDDWHDYDVVGEVSIGSG
jgi:hypothetical protein